MKQLKDLYKQATTDEDRALWREQIGVLQLDLFDGEELAKQREADLAEEKRLEEERAKAERLAKQAADREAAKLAAQQADREGYLKGEIDRIAALILPIQTTLDEAYTRMEEENPWTEDVDYDEYNAAWIAFEEEQLENNNQLWGTWDEETGEQVTEGLIPMMDDLQAEYEVIVNKKAEATAAIAEAEAIAKAAKEKFEAEAAAAAAAEAARVKAEAEAAVKAEAKRVKAEKEAAAAKAAEEEARIAE
jgi:hypothetical protein